MTAEVESIFPDEPGSDHAANNSHGGSSETGAPQGQSGHAGAAAVAPDAAPKVKKARGIALPFHPKFLVMGLFFVAVCVFAFRDQLFGAEQPTMLTQGPPESVRMPVQQSTPTTQPPTTSPIAVAANEPMLAPKVVDDELGWKGEAELDGAPTVSGAARAEVQDGGWNDTQLDAAPAAQRHDRKSAREVALAEDLYQSNKRAEDAEIKLGQLSGEIEKLKMALQALEQKVASLPASAPAPSKPKNAVAAAPKPAAQVAKRAPAQANKHSAFRINTIYPDQAWVDKGDRTYIVQVGDVLEGARILRIDTSARRIVTSAGDIR